MEAAIWSPTQPAAEAIEVQGGSSQSAELKAIQQALDIAEREMPVLYLYTNSWMAVNDLGVAGLMEKGQLATRRETHLGC